MKKVRRQNSQNSQFLEEVLAKVKEQEEKQDYKALHKTIQFFLVPSIQTRVSLWQELLRLINVSIKGKEVTRLFCLRDKQVVQLQDLFDIPLDNTPLFAFDHSFP